MDANVQLSQEGEVLCDQKDYRSQFVSQPYTTHMLAAQRVPSTSSLELNAFSDADLATCSYSRQSVIGFCTFFGNSLLSWRSKKQSTVSRSSAEAEYRAIAQACCEVVSLLNLLKDFGVHHSKPVPLFCGNQSHPIIRFMNVLNILRLIVTSSGRCMCKASSSHCTLKGSINSQISSLRLYHLLVFFGFLARWGFIPSSTPILRGGGVVMCILHEDLGAGVN